MWAMGQYIRVAAAFWPFPGNVGGVSGQGGEFPVVAGGVVADQTIHCGVRLVHVFPAIANVAGSAAGLVGNRHAAEAVDHLALAQLLAGFRVIVEPGPVAGALDLVSCFGVATQAGFGDFRGVLKGAFERLELAVVGGGR